MELQFWLHRMHPLCSSALSHSITTAASFGATRRLHNPLILSFLDSLFCAMANSKCVVVGLHMGFGFVDGALLLPPGALTA